MSDEGKAGLVSIIWLTVFGIFVVSPSAIKTLLLISTTIILIMYCKHDNEKEQLRKRRSRYVRHATEELSRELSGEQQHFNVLEEFAQFKK